MRVSAIKFRVRPPNLGARSVTKIKGSATKIMGLATKINGFVGSQRQCFCSFWGPKECCSSFRGTKDSVAVRSETPKDSVAVGSGVPKTVLQFVLGSQPTKN